MYFVLADGAILDEAIYFREQGKSRFEITPAGNAHWRFSAKLTLRGSQTSVLPTIRPKWCDRVL
jgi:hypothetical protein